MEADLVDLGGSIAQALARADMDEDRSLVLEEGLAERRVERDEVVAEHRADVRDPEVLEELPGLRELDDRVPEATRPLEQRRPDHRHPGDEIVVGAARAAPAAGELDAAQVLAHRADRGRDAHLVVVQHDDQARPALSDVVQRFQRQPAHERRVPDDDRDVLLASAPVTGEREPRGDGDPGAGVPAVHDVVLALAASREATDAAELAQRVEALQAAGQELVRIGLVPGVPDDPIARAVEDPMQRDRQLDDAQRAAQMAARDRDRLDDALAQLGAELARRVVVESLQVLGAAELRERPHASSSSSPGRRSSVRVDPPAASTRRWTRSSAAARSWPQCSWSATPRS